MISRGSRSSELGIRSTIWPQDSARGPAMLLYELLDSQIDAYIPIIDAFEAQLERLGEISFSPMKMSAYS